MIVNITSPEINFSPKVNLYVDFSHGIPLILANLIQLNRIVRNKVREWYYIDIFETDYTIFPFFYFNIKIVKCLTSVVVPK